MVVPYGNDAARNSTPVTGETRYNTEAGENLGFMEVYNDNVGAEPPAAGAWQRAAGEGSEVTTEILEGLTNLYILVLG